MATMATSDGLTDAQSLRLQNWFSPAFPVGSFSYSHGLEAAIDAGAVTSLDQLITWIEDTLAFGSGRNDGIFFAESWRCFTGGFDERLLVEVAELAAAMRNSSELALESTAQGSAFLSTVLAISTEPRLSHISSALSRREITLAISVIAGAVSVAHDLPLQASLIAYLNSFVAMLISAAAKLIPLGQTDVQRATLALEQPVIACAERSIASTLDDIGSATLMTDIYSMRHETQYSRMFRS